MTAWLIWSNEHRAWWGPGRMGYTTLTHLAGLYTKTDADEICRRALFGSPKDGPPNEVAVLAPFPGVAQQAMVDEIARLSRVIR